MNDSTDTHARRRPKSRAKFAIIAVAALALVGFGAWKLLGKGEDEGGYMFAQVEVGNIEDLVTATGTLEPRDYVDVGAQVSGQIKKLFVEVGDVVKVGDVLAEIDPEQAQARVDANRAQLKSSETSLLTQRNNLEKAERDYQRQLNLKKEDATTEEALINAKTTLDNARNQIVQSEAQIAQQKANMRVEERNLQYTKIIAPIDGTVMSIAVKEGQTVNASQNVPNVLKLANLSTMTVRTDVSEADVSKLYKGMPVYFTTLGAGQNRRWYGEVKRIEPTPKTQQGVVLYPALFDVQNELNADGMYALMPNATTQVFFIAAQARDVLTVPMAALQQGQQISREMAAKEREKKGETAQADGPQRPQAAAPAGPEGAAVAAGSASSTEASGAPANVQGAPGEGMRGNRPGGGNGQRPGGGFGGQRPGGGNFANLTPEQREEMIRRFREGGGPGGPGGFGGFGGGFGGGMAAGNTRQPQQRRGTVMVKKADGSLEPRQVVVGVNDRVRGEVIEGLKEGEEVVVAKRETEPQTGPTASGNNNNNNNFRPNQGFPGGGNFRPF